MDSLRGVTNVAGMFRLKECIFNVTANLSHVPFVAYGFQIVRNSPRLVLTGYNGRFIDLTMAASSMSKQSLLAHRAASVYAL